MQQAEEGLTHDRERAPEASPSPSPPWKVHMETLGMLLGWKLINTHSTTTHRLQKKERHGLPSAASPPGERRAGETCTYIGRSPGWHMQQHSESMQDGTKNEEGVCLFLHCSTSTPGMGFCWNCPAQVRERCLAVWVTESKV